MAVPNTTTFDLQDVVDEVNPLSNDLVACFAAANDDYFNPLYEGNKDNLLNFRDYGSHNVSQTIIVDPEHISIASRGGYKYVDVSTTPSSGLWLISLSPSWVTATKTDNTTLTLNISANRSLGRRSGYVVLEHSINSSVTASVSISQDGGGLL